MGNRGFTLIELLVVLVIVSTIIGLVGPSLFKTVDKIRASSEKKKVASILGRAKTLSFCRNSRISVQLNRKKLILSMDNRDSKLAGQFKFLTFEDQKILFNKNGFPDKHEIRYLLDGEKKVMLF